MEIFKQISALGNPTEKKMQVTKSIGSFIFGTSKSFDELEDETIQVEIERANGSNFEITKGAISLQRFLLATTFGEDSIQSSTEGVINFHTIAVCEICEDGSIHLFEKDVLKITLKGLDENHSYLLNGIEEPTSSLQVYSYESKSMGSDDTNKDFNVEGYDILILDKSDSIDEISYTVALSDGSSKIIKYSQFELNAIYKSTDPVGLVKLDGTIKSGFNKYLQLPLNAVTNVNIRKTQGTVVNLLLRTQI